MALFHIKWLRRFIRRNTSPIPEDKAGLWKTRLSVLYMLIGWNTLGVLCYYVYTGRSDWAKYYGYKSEEEAQISPGRQFAELFNVKKGKIVRISGFHIAEESDIEEKTNNEAAVK